MASVLQSLLRSDPAIRWQALRDLHDASAAEVSSERARVARAGWGRKLLALQTKEGQWGGGLYTPKWTSTTYTLLLLRLLGLPDHDKRAAKAARLLLDKGLYRDGGINLWLPRRTISETCVTGMALAIGSHFAVGDRRLDVLASHLLEQQMEDGGWNCQRPRGATHSSLHTTISVLEGLLDYERAGGAFAPRTQPARARAHEFLFSHHMFRSHRTGKMIDTRMTRFSFPPQWHYDVLRGLDYLRDAGAPRDPRIGDAIELLRRRRTPEGWWELQSIHHGKYHFLMEQPGTPSAWNTLRALRVLRWWEQPGSRA